MKKLKPVNRRRTPPKPPQGFGVFGYRFDDRGQQIDASGAVLDIRGEAAVDGEETDWIDEYKRKGQG